MGISAILAATVKNLPWRSIATAALERAPELYQKVRERLQKPAEQQAEEAAAEAELQARLTRLEGLLLEQEEVIRRQAAETARLEEACSDLESRLLRSRIISGVLGAAALITLALLLKR